MAATLHPRGRPADRRWERKGDDQRGRRASTWNMRDMIGHWVYKDRCIEVTDATNDSNLIAATIWSFRPGQSWPLGPPKVLPVEAVKAGVKCGNSMLDLTASNADSLTWQRFEWCGGGSFVWQRVTPEPEAGAGAAPPGWPSLCGQPPPERPQRPPVVPVGWTVQSPAPGAAAPPDPTLDETNSADPPISAPCHEMPVAEQAEDWVVVNSPRHNADRDEWVVCPEAFCVRSIACEG
mmetsp:Transcript_81486/g.186491  ORF Transcript_81486/g.186491 Transcript_81486/m.186491 type:complete len:236 (+) Transcript_81486:18-725(+)